jgi:hypothetical protein
MAGNGLSGVSDCESAVAATAIAIETARMNGVDCTDFPSSYRVGRIDPAD